MFGSEGTLGIITSAIVKIFPLPEVQKCMPDWEKVHGGNPAKAQQVAAK